MWISMRHIVATQYSLQSMSRFSLVWEEEKRPLLRAYQRRLDTRHHSRDILKVSARATIDTEKLKLWQLLPC